MTTPDTKPMQGLADWLRAMSGSAWLNNGTNAATLRQWASEVEAAAQAPAVAIVDKAFDEQTLWAGYVSQNHFGATGEGGLFHFKRGAGFARRMLSTPASETAPSVQPEPLTPKAFAELCDLAREINNRPNSNCPIKCESMEQCSGACDFMEAAPQPAVVEALTKASLDVLEERQRQISAKGWTPEHDDEHGDGAMALAAACYALEDRKAIQVRDLNIWTLWRWTGWAEHCFKPKDKRRNLVRAGALILAEIERLDRAAMASSPAPKEPQA